MDLYIAIFAVLAFLILLAVFRPWRAKYKPGPISETFCEPTAEPSVAQADEPLPDPIQEAITGKPKTKRRAAKKKPTRKTRRA